MADLAANFTSNVISSISKYSAFNEQSQLHDLDLILNAQQQHRFVVLMDDIPPFYVGQIDRPSYDIAVKEHTLLDHVMRYPVRVKWSQINLTIKEIYGGDTVGSVGGNIMNKLLAHSYYYPDDVITSQASGILSAITNPLGALRDEIYGTRNLTKENLVKSLGKLQILALKADGTAFETWTIYNGMIAGVKFSQNSYNGEALTDVNLTIQYDWAKLQLGSTF